MAFTNLEYTDGRIYKGDPTQDNFFKGTWDLDQSNLQNYDPFVGGYAFIIWTKLPKFFAHVPDGENFTKRFKYMTERNFKALDGINDLQLESEAVNLGFAGNTMDVATNLKKPDAGFTLKHQEYVGSPIRKLYEFWITGIRDPETGLATYHGALNADDNGLYYSAENHTGELLYVVTDPSGCLAGSKGIEFACYFTNVFPTKIPQAHLNYASGEHGTHEVDQEFKGVYHTSAAIYKLAGQVMKTRLMLKSFNDYGSDDDKVGMTPVKTGWDD